MNSIKEIFDSLSDITSNPIAPVYSRPADTPKPENKPQLKPELALEDVDWESFTIGGVKIVELLRKAINKLIVEYNNLPDKGDGLTFTLQDIYKTAGIDNVPKVYEQLTPEEEEIILLEDEEFMNWRYYVTLAALEAYNDDWDVEIKESIRPTNELIDDIFDSVGYMASLFPFEAKILRETQDEVLRHNTLVLLREESLANDVVVMTYPELDGEDVVDEEDEVVEDENPKEAPKENPEPRLEANTAQQMMDFFSSLFGKRP